MKNVKIENVNGSPSVIINGKVYPPMFMTVATTDIKTGKLLLDREYFKRLGESGIKIFFPITDTEWGRPGALEQFKELAEFIFDAVPDAYLVVRIGLHAPDEWVKANPDECFTYSDGSKPSVRLASESYHADYTHHYSMCSQKWREKAGEALIEACKAHDKLPFADRIIGYFFAAGGTSEWYYEMPLEAGDKYGDFSEAFRREFSRYLKEKYGDDETLRKAWRDERTSIENPYIYGLSERYFAHHLDWEKVNIPYPEHADTTEIQTSPYNKEYNIGNFLDMDKALGLADFYKAYHSTVADSQIYFGKLVKEHYKGDILTGGFYGSLCWNNYTGGTTAGAALKIINSDAIDFLAAPGDYNNRNPGGFTGQREVQDSFRLRNKIFVVEEDTRTHVEPPYFRTLVECFDMQDSINVIKRNFGRNLSEDLHAWWFDQMYGGGRYRFEEIYDLFSRQQEIMKKAYAQDRTKGNEIAIIFDEESLCSISNLTTRSMLQYFRDYEVARIGAGVDYYFHNDLALSNMPDYKLYVFLNTFELSAKERADITAKLSKNGATALWLYAPGVIDVDAEKRLSVEHIQELTGFKTSMVNLPMDMKFRINGEKHSLTAGLDTRKLYGYENLQDKCNIFYEHWLPSLSYAFPYFYPDDVDATILGYNCMKGLPALAVKEYNGFTSVYHASKIINYEIIRSIAEGAGCHIYSHSGDVVYASDNFVTIHASSTGVKKLRFKNNCSPFEVYEKRYYGENVKEIEVEMQIGDTLTFSIKEGEI